MAALLLALVLAAPARAYVYRVVADKSCDGVTLTTLELMPVPVSCKPVRLVKSSSIAILRAGWEVERESRPGCMTGGWSALGSIDADYVDVATWRVKNASRKDGDKDTTFVAVCLPAKAGKPRRLTLQKKR